MTSPAAQRLNQVTSHLSPQSARDRILAKSPDDVVITLALRTPLTKARKGLLRDTPVDLLLTSLLTSIRTRLNFPAELVEDVCVGNVLTPSPGYAVRSAVLAAGFPVSTAANVASRFCSSGLLSVQNVATAIAAGSIDVGIAVGVESMSCNPDGGAPEISESLLGEQVVRDNMMPMGWTSENVARDFGVTREMQDEVAAVSQQRAEKAKKEGWTKDEIVEVKTSVKNGKGGWEEVVVKEDDGVRAGTTKEALGKLRAAFPQWQPATTTGGNASQITDGAAGVVLMKRSKAQELGVRVLGKFVLSTSVGLEPRIMGIGPSLAIPKLLQKTGLTKDDVDLWEINEAFSSMYVYCLDKLQLDREKVNVRGGAIALGHPLVGQFCPFSQSISLTTKQGCTGTRQLVTILSEMRRRQAKLGCSSMCVGTGAGMAGLVVNEA